MSGSLWRGQGWNTVQDIQGPGREGGAGGRWVQARKLLESMGHRPPQFPMTTAKEGADLSCLPLHKAEATTAAWGQGH